MALKRIQSHLVLMYDSKTKLMPYVIVPESRFELPRRCQHQPLKLARLPISPPGYLGANIYLFSL